MPQHTLPQHGQHAVGGPLALVENGDEIELSIPEARIDLLVDELADGADDVSTDGRRRRRELGRVAVVDAAVTVTADAPTNSLVIQASKEGFGTLSEVIALTAERGSYILAENYVYTTEAFQDYLDHLAPGGRLVIEEPDIRHWAVKLVALAEKVLLMRSHFYTPLDIRAMFGRAADCGCIVHIERQGHTAWVIVDKVQNVI